MTQPKKMIVRDLKVTEVSSVDIPAVKGATAVLLKGAAVDIRKNAADVAAGQAAPLYKAAEYGDAMIARSVELAKQHGGTPEAALFRHCGTDPELVELAKAERAAEMEAMRTRKERHSTTNLDELEAEIAAARKRGDHRRADAMQMGLEAERYYRGQAQ